MIQRGVERMSMLLIAAVALMPLASACARSAPSLTSAEDAAVPQIAAQAAYRWYMALLAEDKDASDDPQGYERYVSAPLRARIERQMNSTDGMDADYFLKAQDYSDSWLTHIAAERGPRTGNITRTTVILGAGSEQWRLTVSMAREGGQWKIAEVTHP